MMKGTFKRLLSFLLMLTILVSLLSVFATATDEETGGEEENEEEVNMLVNRTFDEGWDVTNGFGWNSARVPGARCFIDNETAIDYTKNYFTRIEFGDRTVTNADSYMIFDMSSLPYNNYLIMQYKVKVDDYLTYNARVCYSLVKSQTGQNNILTLNKDEIGVMGQKVADTSTNWVTLTYVFDFTNPTYKMSNNTNCKCGKLTVTATDESGNVLGTASFEEAFSMEGGLRFGSHDKNTNVAGESFCLDDFICYTSNTGRVLSREEVDSYGYGSNVSTSKPFTIPIDKGTSEEEISSNRYEDTIGFKVGVEYCLEEGEKRAPIYEAENGDVYGTPIVHNGKIYLPLEKILAILGYEYYIHSNGLAYDVSSGLSSSSVFAGRDTAIADGKNIFLSAKPEYITQKVGENSYEFLAICMDDVEAIFPGVDLFYDRMGFIFISRMQGLFDESQDNMSTFLNMMKKFIYPEVTAEGIREMNAAQTLAKNGEVLKHPYIYATQEDFDKMALAYTMTASDENYDPYVTTTVQAYVAEANNVLKTWAAAVKFGEEGYEEALSDYLDNGIGIRDGRTIYLPYLTAKPGNASDPHHVGRRTPSGTIITEKMAAKATNNGYDTSGGRLGGGSDTIGNRINTLAVAYHVTGNITYAMVAYEMMTGLAEWDHWGPGHFLNCADTAQRYAVNYDWLYNAFVELETTEDPAIAAYREKNEYNYAKKEVADGLYWNGLYAGYSTAINKVLPENRNYPELGTAQLIPGTTHSYTGWYQMTQNWNCVCNCGILLTALALLDETDETRVSQINTMLEVCYNGLTNYGLDCYAPDGSYPEGAGYWQYGTVQFFKTIAAFKSALGTDLNLLSAPGIDRTCYFAIHAFSNEGYRLGYHDDDAEGELDSSLFIMVGEGLGDEAIIQLRMNRIRAGTALSVFDLIYWDSKYLEPTYQLPNSYFMEGIDTFVVRDGWESGALYVGIHGGKNTVNHGHIDSGTFLYVKDGIDWFCELGSENYNVGGYFSNTTRYTFYRCNTEGQNTICLVHDQINVKYGQRSDATSKTVAYGENEYGAYHILDMKDCYYTNANYGYRGLLVTNDYKTTVIYDDIQFKKFDSLYWFGHTKQDILEISDDGKTAFLGGPDGEVLRVTLLSNVSSYKFIEMTAYQTVLDVTVRQEENKNEYSRSEFKKLAIYAENQIAFTCAVVIEAVESIESNEPLGYTKEDFNVGMYNGFTGQVLWEPAAKEEKVEISTNLNFDLIINPAMVEDIALDESTVNSNLTYIRILGGDRFGSEIVSFYRWLVEIEYISAFIKIDSNSRDTYRQSKAEYSDFVEATNVEIVNLSLLSKSLLGF